MSTVQAGPLKRIKVSYKVAETGEERRSHVEFTEDEWDRLQQFLRNVDELRASGTLEQDLQCSVRMTGGRDGRCTWECIVPSRSAITLLLHHLRRLILEKEAANFLRIAKLVGRRLDDESLRTLLKDLRKHYKGRRGQEMWLLTANGLLLNSDEALFDWLNGFEYHRLKRQRQRIEGLFGIIPKEAVQAVLVSLLIDKLVAILDLEQLVLLLVCRTKKLNILMPSSVWKKGQGSS